MMVKKIFIYCYQRAAQIDPRNLNTLFNYLIIRLNKIFNNSGDGIELRNCSNSIIGTATSGTGFGFTSSNRGSTNFRDPLNLYIIGIPNFAFQNQLEDKTADQKNSYDFNMYSIDFIKIKLMENDPVIPDHTLNYTVNDVVNNFADYKKGLEKIIIK